MKLRFIPLALVLLLFGCVAPPPSVPATRQQPRPLAMPVPAYPEELRKDGISGEVVVDFNVGPDGKVYKATVLKSPHPRLSALVLEFTKQWRFEPATINGRPVATHLRTPVRFALVDQPTAPSKPSEPTTPSPP